MPLIKPLKALPIAPINFINASSNTPNIALNESLIKSISPVNIPIIRSDINLIDAINTSAEYTKPAIATFKAAATAFKEPFTAISTTANIAFNNGSNTLYNVFNPSSTGANAFAISSAYLIKKPTANVRPAKGPNLPNNLNNTPLLPKNPIIGLNNFFIAPTPGNLDKNPAKNANAPPPPPPLLLSSFVDTSSLEGNIGPIKDFSFANSLAWSLCLRASSLSNLNILTSESAILFKLDKLLFDSCLICSNNSYDSSDFSTSVAPEAPTSALPTIFCCALTMSRAFSTLSSFLSFTTISAISLFLYIYIFYIRIDHNIHQRVLLQHNDNSGYNLYTYALFLNLT